MEWLAGRTLDAILREHAPLPVEQVAQLGVDLSEALDAAHAAGVIHRDIKPSNLIILPDGRLKVTDFCLARPELREQSVTGYEGFVRMGARRGFHLLLVLEKDDGFEAILPL